MLVMEPRSLVKLIAEWDSPYLSFVGKKHGYLYVVEGEYVTDAQYPEPIIAATSLCTNQTVYFTKDEIESVDGDEG